jgi:uncharacterized membrane protein YgcG
VPSGDPFSENQLREVSRTLRRASAETGLHFSLFIGPVPGETRQYAGRLLGALGERAPAAVLICVAPEERRLEIVTGEQAHHRLNDRACGLAALSMTTSFAGGDLVGGMLTGVRMLAESAGRVRQVAAG